MFLVSSGNRWLKYKTFLFSGGEVSVKLTPEETSFEPSSKFYIDAHITNSNQVMELVLLKDALDRTYGNPTIHLTCPYLPYARQDRVCAPGESLSLRVFCDIINSLNFASVTVKDVHSDVALALLNNVVHYPVDELIGNTIHDVYRTNKPVLVAPDAGARKKVLKVAQRYNLPMISADKVRDVNTGEITGTVVHSDDLGNQQVLVVDDICDGGRTFVELAKVLSQKTSGKLYLYVTHGIFSQGLDKLLDWYDTIYSPYVFPNVPHNERLKRI
jgi:ribose-phosphate pyrophosphokinase